MKNVFNNNIKKDISELAGNNNRSGIIQILENFIGYDTEFKTGSNEYYITKFLPWLKGETDVFPFKVFKIGNSKLPFLNFSTLPIVTCIGAGICKKYCYSFKAWRYPASFLRQVQNTLLMFEFDLIEKELNKFLNTKQLKKDKLNLSL